MWEREGSSVPFTLQETTTVGREDADVNLGEALVSRLHARIERRGNAWFVVDLGSTNLTRVNGLVVRERQLAPGDEVQFARARCRFYIDAPAETDAGIPPVE